MMGRVMVFNDTVNNIFELLMLNVNLNIYFSYIMVKL